MAEDAAAALAQRFIDAFTAELTLWHVERCGPSEVGECVARSEGQECCVDVYLAELRALPRLTGEPRKDTGAQA